jgi:hypothetical protein
MMNDHDALCPTASRSNAHCQCPLIARVRADYAHALGAAEQAALDEMRAGRG